MTTESKLDPSHDAPTAHASPASVPQEIPPAAEALARKVPHKGLLLAIAFCLALLLGAGVLLVGLNKL